MSWYVRELLLNRDSIRSNLFQINNEDTNILDSFLDDDTYLDLLDVERCVKDLYIHNMFVNDETKVLELVVDGKSLIDCSYILHMSRNKIYYVYNSACDKIAFTLGGHFTNEGFLDYLLEKYKLDEEQYKTIKDIIENYYD